MHMVIPMNNYLIQDAISLMHLLQSVIGGISLNVHSPLALEGTFHIWHILLQFN
jgi:hypothetical protein